MPNARVGAMPQPSRPKEQQQQDASGKGRGSRHKGISMEDLKQQTALRLAKEQQHHRNGSSGNTRSGGNRFDDDVKKPEPANVLNNSQLAHFNRYNGTHQQGPLHHAYEMRDRIYSADGSCTSSLSHDNGCDTSSTGLPAPMSAPISSAAAVAAASAAVLSPMVHASSSRMNQPIRVSNQFGSNDGVSQKNKNSGKITSKLNYVGGSPSFSQRQTSSQQVQLGGQSNRPNQPKSAKKKQQRHKVPPDADHYCPPGQQQYQVYASMDLNDSSTNYPTAVFQPERQRRNKKSGHRPTTNAHGHFHPQSVMTGQGGHHGMQFGGKQSKLPHGLTVQELKEMTKARLAAEAAEKNDQNGGLGEDPYNAMQQDLSQPDVSSNHSVHSVATHASSGSEADSYRRLDNKSGQMYYPFIQNRQHSMDSTSSAPASNAQSQYHTPVSMFKSRSHHRLSDFSYSGSQHQRQIRMSPDHSSHQSYGHHSMSHQVPPPGLSNNQQGHMIPHHSNQNVHKQHQQSKEWRQQLDALETASVNSMSSALGSEYLGPESAFGTVQSNSSTSMTDDAGNMSFGRSRSYPTGCNLSNALEQPSHENTPLSTAMTSSSLFDFSAGSGSNRRRTLTMSPPLSNLHEDRPLTASSLGADDYLSIPLFDSLSNTQLRARGHHDEFTSSPNTSRGSSPAFSRFVGTNNALGCGDIFQPHNFNSMSTTTPSGDNEDKKKGLLPLSFGSSDRAISAGGVSMNGELPNSVAESVLGAPLIMEGRKALTNGRLDLQHSGREGNNENDISAVFRNGPGYLGSENSVGRGYVPGREVSLSSTSSFFSDTNIIGQSTEFGAPRSRTHTWEGASSAITPIGVYEVPDEDTDPPSNLADDINKLLNFPDERESIVLSTPFENDPHEKHSRVPSLVSRIDPELKADTTFLLPSFSSSQVMGNDGLHLPNQVHSVMPEHPILDSTLNKEGSKESSGSSESGSSSFPQQSKQSSSTKRKNRKGRRKLKGDERSGFSP
uniref:Uncharacterized protein n=1 Tax=Ditylum brightwellii TaxID=49249 RepID=A0A7S2ERA5_9STRA|mmetsp:Transcript_39398/g.59215  ORF Transcript_39398/g.59215 Transcript_39398/m.59215 type:complete len:1002 (+) Transcript_39398:314-3319(+)